MNSVSDLSTVFDRIAFLLLVEYVLVLPYEQLLRATTNLLVLAIAATTTLSVLSEERDVSISRYQFFSIGAFAGILAWAGLAALIGPAPLASLLASRVYVLYFIVTAAFVVVVDSQTRIRWILAAIAFVAAVVGFLSVVNFLVELPFAKHIGQTRSFGPVSLGINRTLGAPMGYGSYGILAMLGGAFATGVLVWPQLLLPVRPRLSRGLGALALVGIASGVGIAQSRSTILAVAVAVGTFTLLAGLRSSNRRVRTVVGTVSVLGAVGAVVVVGRAIAPLVATNAEAVERRIMMYCGALSKIGSHPFVGCGWSCARGMAENDVLVHNSWLLIGVVAGLPALVLWAVLFVSLFVGMLRLLWMSDEVGMLALMTTTGFAGGLTELALFPGITDTVALLLGVAASVAGLGGVTYRLREVLGTNWLRKNSAVNRSIHGKR